MGKISTHFTNILHQFSSQKKLGVLFAFFIFVYAKALSQSYDYDYRENAVYIYNFIRYTEWPSDKKDIVIGVVGYTPFVPEFRRLLLKKKNSSLNISLRYIKVSEADNVDVVMVSVGASDKLKEIQGLTNKLPILIITEKGDLNRQGACISLFIDEDDDFKTRYQLSLRNCRARGLGISDQILNNAILVR